MKNATGRTKSKDAIALLEADHKLVQKLFKEFDHLKGKSTAKEKSALVEKICNELKIHTQIEEEIFYPAAHVAISDDDLIDEATVEHQGAKDLIAQLEAAKPSDELYDAKVTVLGEYITHHVKEEQEEMFPKVKKAKLDLDELGEQLASRKAELQEDFLSPMKGKVRKSSHTASSGKHTTHPH